MSVVQIAFPSYEEIINIGSKVSKYVMFVKSGCPLITSERTITGWKLRLV